MRVASSSFRPIRGTTAPASGSHSTNSLTCLIRQSHRSASAKLFADAEKEEEEAAQRHPKPSQADILINKNENWDGEERVQDTVLRMLMDKYKPLRTGQIQSADEKLKASLPQVSNKSFSKQANDEEPDPESMKQESPGEPIPPWLVTFKVPSHAQASIKLGNFVSTPPRPVTSNPFATPSSGPRSFAERKAEKRFAEGAGRLDRARESTLDYRIGTHGQESSGGRMRPNPVSMRGWNNLIEERIQQARVLGAFDKLEGRGKPLARTADEMNPFVAREEFLMNRIVRKNDAAPPWVELQKDAERATAQMRELLLTGWVRRTLRILPLSYSTTALEAMTPESATRLRDAEWEQQEKKFHDAAIREANDTIRRYNTIAPYVVRRPLLTREAELDKCYADSGALIIEGIQERLASGKGGRSTDVQDGPEETTPVDMGQELRRLLRNAVQRLYARFSNVV
ncbi:hypothetical protein RhiJN_15699 [Ceratobasidium sp. AG-Ba]|nr:hypothetical protein RhiJN_15699 [Ceratobasidium sp. AG-Ba]